MKVAFCTIITTNFINYALSLFESLSRHEPVENFYILISDSDVSFEAVKVEFPAIKILYVSDVCIDEYGKTIKDKYQATNMDCFRWSMKPVLIKYLLEHGYDRAFFLDPDLYFYTSHRFLSKELEDSSVLLTPHWRASTPDEDSNNFAIVLKLGLFNAGFVGSSKAGIPAMEWWANLCAYECTKAPERGVFDDQGYLNLMPIYFEGVKVLRHKGCNVANWNQVECKRTIDREGNVLINDRWEIAFIHFTRSTIKGILSGKDALLRPHLEQYQASLQKFSSWIPEEFCKETRETKTETREGAIPPSTSIWQRVMRRSHQIIEKIKRKIFL